MIRMTTDDGHELIYHYTNVDGLIGIVNSKKLWATKIQYLDDTSELTHAFSLAKDIAYRIKRETDNEPTKELLEKISEHFESMEAINIFVFSFSYASDLLSQWRAYAHNGGYALGFDPRVIKTLAKQQGFKFLRCIYDEKEQKNRVEIILKNHLSSFLTQSNAPKKTEEIDKMIKDISERVVVEVTSVSPTFKHPSFVEEQECRLISEWKPSADKAINCRNKGNLVIPYYEFDLENDGIEFNVQEIMVGPGLPRKLAVGSVEILFNSKRRSYHCISHTSIPLG